MSEERNEASTVEMNNSLSVLHKIAHLYAEQLMSDLRIKVGNKYYPAHRVILCASSEVFQVMLMNPEWNEWSETVIELKEDPVCYPVFPSFLEYLYKGQIKISLDTCMPILSLADKYNIKDLVQLCSDYMHKHFAVAAKHGCFVSWLSYVTQPFHRNLAEELLKFLKWNLKIVAERDFFDLDINILVMLLQQNDLVIDSEYSLFKTVQKWCLFKRDQIINESSLSDEEKKNQVQLMTEEILQNIRWPMMTTAELAQISQEPLVKSHTELITKMIVHAINFHSGCLTKRKGSFDLDLIFTPRLYTNDPFCVGINVPEFEKFEDYKSIATNFFSQMALAEADQNDQTLAWEIDFFPRGVRYNAAKLINWYATAEIPEVILKTVRMRITCREKQLEDKKFVVGVLISGIQNKITYVRTVYIRVQYFSRDENVLIIDNLLPYEELELSSVNLSPYLIGSQHDTLDLSVIIIPLSELSCSIAPKFEFD